MCGINGIFAYHPDAPAISREELIRTRDAMFARGPDGHGEWLSGDGRLGIAHRRLAIIDLSDAGAQPMSTIDGRLKIVFNGEIYNYRELRAHLAAEGVSLRSESDTEVLLHLYLRYGEEMVHQLRGMFAFAIWDGREQTLFLARDPYGIKPLYYSDDGRVFRFSSQVKALQSGGQLSRELDPAGVCGFFLWGSVPEPFTMYRDVHGLPAGSVMKVTRSGRDEPRRYWELGAMIGRSIEASRQIPGGAEIEYVSEALRDSLNAHMVADVPVGAFLSAGLDSSTVVGLAREVSGNSLQTITLAFEEFQGKIVDESPLAARIARHLDVQHKILTVDMADVEAELQHFLDAMDQPTIDGVNTWFVSKAASQAGLKVALSGLGGDELLGGYSSFQEVPRTVRTFFAASRIPLAGDIFCKAYSRLIAPYTSFNPKFAGLLKYGGSYAGAYQLHRGVFMPWELDQVLSRDFVSIGLARLNAQMEEPGAVPSQIDGFAQLVELESSRYMRNQLLRDTDWAGMAHSLEVRVPLVDSVLAEKIVGLGATGRLGSGKSILPSTLSRGLPKEALERPKTGFTVPIWKWLRKSEEFDAWKRIGALSRGNVHDYNRWAYTLISRLPEARGIIKGTA